jgi:hypothetical protein
VLKLAGLYFAQRSAVNVGSRAQVSLSPESVCLPLFFSPVVCSPRFLLFSRFPKVSGKTCQNSPHRRVKVVEASTPDNESARARHDLPHSRKRTLTLLPSKTQISHAQLCLQKDCGLSPVTICTADRCDVRASTPMTSNLRRSQP